MKVNLIKISDSLEICDLQYVHYKDNIEGEYGFLSNHQEMTLRVNYGVLTCRTESQIFTYHISKGLLSINKNIIWFIGNNYEQTSNSRISV